MSSATSATPSLLERFGAGDVRALSRLLSLVEDEHPQASALLTQIYPKANASYRVGITGAPGAGKSTLVNLLAAHLMAAGDSVGILAVDPTSPFSGGALLGDRIRFDYPAPQPGQKPAFFRSAASRGHTGGLARRAEEMAVVLEAFGYARLLIETVGVGQVGLDIAQAADTTVVVLVPESGDDIQAHKAGLLEIADVMVVNKADRPGAASLRDQLRDGVHNRRLARTPGWETPVVMTQGSNGDGIGDLATAIEAHRQYRLKQLGQAGIRKERLRHVILNLVREELRVAANDSLAQGELPGGMPLEPRLDAVVQGSADPFTIARDAVRKLFGK
ncbi:MAG TPA: methylmalonyl Co-A mutase-associated GTPase MeaB [bacterium]